MDHPVNVPDVASQLDKLRTTGNKFFARQSYGDAIDIYTICISECVERLGEDILRHVDFAAQKSPPPADTNCKSKCSTEDPLRKFDEDGFGADQEDRDDATCSPSSTLSRLRTEGSEFFAARRYDEFRKFVFSRITEVPMEGDAAGEDESEGISDDSDSANEVEGSESGKGGEESASSGPAKPTSSSHEFLTPPNATKETKYISAGARNLFKDPILESATLLIKSIRKVKISKDVDTEHKAAYKMRNTLLLSWTNRAEAWLALNYYDNALDDAEKALQLQPSHLKSLVRKGKALEGLEMFEEASLCYSDALQYWRRDDSTRKFIKEAFTRTRTLFKEAVTGVYDISKYCNEYGLRDKSPRFFKFF